MSKFVGTGPSSYEKRIYRAAVSQRLRNTGLRCGSAATRLLGLRVRISPVACMSLCCESCLLSGRGETTDSSLHLLHIKL